MAQAEVMLKNPYDVLGVPSNCPQSAITKVSGPLPQLLPVAGARHCACALVANCTMRVHE